MLNQEFFTKTAAPAFEACIEAKLLSEDFIEKFIKSFKERHGLELVYETKK